MRQHIPDAPYIQQAERCGGFPDSPQEDEEDIWTNEDESAEIERGIDNER